MSTSTMSTRELIEAASVPSDRVEPTAATREAATEPVRAGVPGVDAKVTAGAGTATAAGLGWPLTPPAPTAPLGWPIPAGQSHADVPRETPTSDAGPRRADVASEPDEHEAPGRHRDPAPAPAIASSVSRGTSHVRTASDIAALPAPLPRGSDNPLALATDVALRARGLRSGANFSRRAQTRVIVVANQKGGVGKTTSAVNLAAALALYGARVLLIDLDPQGNASTALGVEHQESVTSMYDVLVHQTPMSEVVQPAAGIDGLWCAPATIDLSGAEVELVTAVARENRLRRALDAHLAAPELQGDGRYDYVFIDCPPSLGLITVNALTAGLEVLIPIQCEYYALEGFSQLLKIVDLVTAQLNPKLEVSAVLLTMYDARTRLASQVADEVRAHFGPTVLATVIPRSVRVSEAPSYSQTVMTYDPGSTGALSYLEAARELAARVGPGATTTRSANAPDEEHP